MCRAGNNNRKVRFCNTGIWGCQYCTLLHVCFALYDINQGKANQALYVISSSVTVTTSVRVPSTSVTVTSTSVTVTSTSSVSPPSSAQFCPTMIMGPSTLPLSGSNLVQFTCCGAEEMRACRMLSPLEG